MADGGDGFALLSGERGQQGAGAAEKQAFELSTAHPAQQMAAENGRAAASAGTAAVDVLCFRVKDYHAAVLIASLQVYALV